MAVEATGLSGVYLLTPDADTCSFDHVLDVVEQALAAGVRVVQYRDKTSNEAQRLDRAGRLVTLTHSAGALLIVNDDIDVAISCGANGVHLGRDDGDVVQAKRRLPHQLVGVSCYNERRRAQEAIAAGADAIAFGSMFQSATKPCAVRAPLALLTDARSTWPQRRVIAIGGINGENIASVAAAGAHAAAVLNAVFGAEDPACATRELVRRFDQGRVRYSQT